ncbi:MAG: hypothetical protein KAI47_15430 [Deltaproteobacteria bacterium]|nr:hypothetical protein [Deltaproteobacteria bacterium]
MPASGEKKNPTEDVAELEGLLEREPASARFWELADAYTRTGRYLDATAVCKRGLTQHPRSARGFVAFGRALFGIGRLGASGQALQRAIDLDPDAPEGYRLLGELLMRRAIYTEAVALLEGALDRGVDDRKLRRLLARAMDSLDSQATTVAQVPDSARGIGNIAVAGTIGGGRFVDDDDEDEEEDDDDDLLLRHDEAEAQQQDLALRAFQTGGAEEREKGVGDANWESLENAWAEHLDAQRETRLSTDPDVPVSSKMPAIALTPLSDPLAEGMPPLPEGTAEIELPTHRRGRDGVSRGPETGPLASRPSASRVVARAGPATGVGEVPLMAAEGLVGDGDEPAPMVDSDALAASGSSGDDVDRDIEIDLDDAKAPAPLSDRRRQVDDNPPTGGASFSSRGAVPDASPRASSQVLSDDDLLSDLRAGGGGSEKDLPTEFVLPPSHRRGRGGRWLLTLIMIAGIGGGGYWGGAIWKRVRTPCTLWSLRARHEAPARPTPWPRGSPRSIAP